MKQVIKRLQEEFNFPLERADAIELFAREGSWHTITYAPYVKSLEAWEINPDFYKGLRRNLQRAKIKIVDTFKEIKDVSRKYDLIVIDNSNSTYGENNKYCEHFDLLPDVFNIANDNCVIILNVNVEPYDFKEGSLWWTRRKEYYKTNHPEKLELNLVAQHYAEICKENNIKLKRSFFQQRKPSYMYYFVMQIGR